jgi:hypothetical protein
MLPLILLRASCQHPASNEFLDLQHLNMLAGNTSAEPNIPDLLMLLKCLRDTFDET